MRIWHLAAIAGALALALWAGTRLSRPEAPAQAAPASGAARVVERPIRIAAAPGPSLDDLRAMIREELAHRAGDEAPPAAAPPARSTEEVRRAVAMANAAVAEGIRTGVWSERERTALRTQLVHLGTAELHEVLSPLFQAINAQRLQLDGPPI